MSVVAVGSLHRKALALLATAALAAGCGTTRVTDTQRTATEQLLVSNAVDQAVSQMDFRSLAGKPVFLDPQYLDNSVDRGYLIGSLRQHLLASGCILQEERSKATYIVEARSGGVGTDRNSLLIGVPQVNLPSIVPGVPTTIPEIPLAKKTDQKGIAKIALFAYNRTTGRPVWQSGVVQATSSAKDSWLLGIGPIQRGTIRDGTEFAGDPIPLPLLLEKETEDPSAVVPVTQAAQWTEPAAPKTPASASPLQPAAAPAPTKEPSATVSKDPPEGKSTGPATGVLSTWATLTPAKPTTPPTTPPSPPPPTPPPTPNAGGQAETQPAKLLISGFGNRPDM